VAYGCANRGPSARDRKLFSLTLATPDADLATGRRLLVFPIHSLVAQSGFVFPVDEMNSPVVLFSMTGRDGMEWLFRSAVVQGPVDSLSRLNKLPNNLITRSQKIRDQASFAIPDA
jgi:hypothetical protein